jgi:hypothetical protein
MIKPKRWDDQACGKRWEKDTCMYGVVADSRRKEYLEVLRVHARIILKWILEI